MKKIKFPHYINTFALLKTISRKQTAICEKNIKKIQSYEFGPQVRYKTNPCILNLWA